MTSPDLQEFAARYSAAAERCRALSAPLGARLSALAEEVRGFAPDFAAATDRAVARLAQVNVGATAPNVGEAMPDCALSDQNGRLLRLSDLFARAPTIVSIDRGHWCPFAQISVDALAQAAPEVARAGGQIVVITPDVARYARGLAEAARAPFPILTDLDNGYALQLGLLVVVEQARRDVMKSIGQDLGAFQGNDCWMFPIPATFVVGRGGLVRARFLHVDYRERMSTDTLIEALRATGNA